MIRIPKKLLIAALLSSAAFAAAQSPYDTTAAQREAMHKLSFLAGNWSGPITVTQGPGGPLHMVQTEHIAYKLNGLVLLIEGTSTAADGSKPFEALATVAFDPATHSYHFRAYNAGRYVDTPLTVVPNGFSWAFDSGPAHVANSMQLTAKGEWKETTTVQMAGRPAQPTVEMLLTRHP